MKKYTLSESRLRGIIRECVKNALEEGQGWNLLKNNFKNVWNGECVDPEKGEYRNYINTGDTDGIDRGFYDEEGQSTNNPTNGQGKRNKKINKGFTGKLGRAAAGAALKVGNELGKAWRKWDQSVEDADSKLNPTYKNESRLRSLVRESVRQALINKIK